MIIVLYSHSDKNPTFKEIIKRILTFPPFIALILAFLFKGFTYPPVLNTIFQTLASTLVPLVMIAVGFQLTFKLTKNTLSPLATGLALKLVAAPLIALVLCRILGFNGTSTNVSIFEAGMPPMVSAGALAIIADLSPSLSAALVGLGIIISFVTLPLLFHLL